eukprot:Partr_v1_DN25540_c0_g1_i5_m20595 putative Cyclin L1
MRWSNNVVAPADQVQSQEDTLPTGLGIQLKLFGCLLIRRASILLKKEDVVALTAQVLLHRFYAIAPMDQYGILKVAMGCTYLACKLEESPTSLRHILNVFDHLRKKYEGGLTDADHITLFSLDYHEGKKMIAVAEMQILCTIGFATRVHHAHPLLVAYLSQLRVLDDHGGQVARTAWSILNDYYASPIVVKYQPHVLACAAMHQVFMRFDDLMGDHYNLEWSRIFDAQPADILAIVEEFTDFTLTEYQKGILKDLPMTTYDLETYSKTRK